MYTALRVSALFEVSCEAGAEESCEAGASPRCCCSLPFCVVEVFAQLCTRLDGVVDGSPFCFPSGFEKQIIFIPLGGPSLRIGCQLEPKRLLKRSTEKVSHVTAWGV